MGKPPRQFSVTQFLFVTILMVRYWDRTFEVYGSLHFATPADYPEFFRQTQKGMQ